MSKRRTKKQKRTAKHNLKISWDPVDESGNRRSNNKKQKTLANRQGNKKTSSKNKATRQNVDAKTSSTKKAIAKSLGLAGFILSLEVAIYLFL